MRSRPCLLFAVLLLLLISTLSRAQTAHLESTEIVKGDIAVLIVEFETGIPSLLPLDTTPLQSDFEVLQVKPTLRRQMRDGRLVTIMHWEIELYPLKSGQVPIASLSIKNFQTPELLLQVDQHEPINEADGDFFFEVSADHTTAYIDQQVMLTIRFFHNRALKRGVIYDFKLTEADIYPFGIDQRYQQITNGEEFTVLERKLLLFARSHGTLQIPAIEFRGEIDGRESRRILRRSTPINLNILPAHTDITAHYWLPATDIQVSQQWFHPQQSLYSGDSISRKISIRANGIAAESLPEDIISQSNPKFEVYVDQPLRIDSIDGRGIVGELEQTHVIVLTKSGPVEIADTEIRWWDVSAQIEKRITLPGKQLYVGVSSSEASSEIPLEAATISSAQNRIMYLTAAMLLTAIIILSAYRYRLIKNQKRIPFNRRKLKQACYSNNIPAAHQQICYLATLEFPDRAAAGLYDLSASSRCQGFKQQLMLLDQAHYGPLPVRWHGRQLWIEYRRHCRNRNLRAKRIQPQLPRLYPG